MQQIFNRILNRAPSSNEEKKDNAQPKENSSLQPNTIEIQNHLIYCLENSSINLLPAIARFGFSSIQNEKILLMKELIQHSKSFIEEPVKEPTQMSQPGLQDFMQIIQNQQDNQETNSEMSEDNPDQEDEEEDQQFEEEEEYDESVEDEDEEYEYESYEDIENQQEIQGQVANQENQQQQNDDEDIQDENQQQEFEGDDYN